MTGALSAGSCDRRTKRSQEELAHVRGQGQKPGGPHARRVAAKRSYPTSEVRGRGREYQTVMAQELPRGATEVQGQGGWLRGATPCQRSGTVARRSYPTSPSLRPGTEAVRSYPSPRPQAAAGRTIPTPEARDGGWEDQPHVEGAMAEQA